MTRLPASPRPPGGGSGSAGSLGRKTSPFADDVRARSVHWVTPRLVGEVGFTEWTDDGRLRHPRFLGLRPDEDPRDVVREASS